VALSKHKKVLNYLHPLNSKLPFRGLRDRDCMVVGFTTANAISAYHH